VHFDARQIAAATSGQLVAEGPAGPVLTDSRAFAAGGWFLALKGDRFDAHDFLGQIAGQSPAGCVVTRLPEGWPSGIVQVADTTKALQDLGRAARERLSGPVVGLTGSAGKTTTRALTALAVSGLGPVHQTVGNLNNQLGVPMTLLATPDDAAVSVIEMGTSSPGEIGFLAEIARPHVRLVVNVGPAHLEELGGIPGVAREKGALFATARPGDVLCVNLDDPNVAAMPRPAGTRAVTWGAASGADIRLLSAELDPARLGTDAVFATPEGEIRVRLPAPGRHIAGNAAGALAVAHALGLDLRGAAAAMERYEPVGMRMRREDLPGGVLALNDAYNANPTSMEASLAVLAELGGRRAAVLGDMLELGSTEAEWHASVAKKAGELGLDLVVLVGPRMSAAAPACAAREVWAEPDPMAVVERLRAWLHPGDRVLFKGSRGARVERVLQALQGGQAPRESH
jgi:UDP-N-acetylmuramoyl-tripeptide--D-alanyl-D-alanine ligase